jgi:uncharacterized protein YaiI (UPF0178 family)
MTLKIWIDADACPNVIKGILFRAAERRKLPLVLVANRLIATPPSQFIKAVQVAGGFDVADSYIVQQCQANDLVITADIPLAAEVVAKQAYALNPRGELYTQENIKEHLAMRDFMSSLRDTGQASGGPSAFGQRDKQAFANALDRFLAAHC